MRLEWDEAKRQKTLRERGLDFADAAEVFAAPHAVAIDSRAAYGEMRWVAFGYLRGRVVNVVFTERGSTRRIISMRRANAREQARFEKRQQED